jgi:hypothetical protein
MAMPEMEAVKDAALKYDKPTLARLAQSGQLSPTLAVMAGMMRDRIVQSEMKPPTPPTVAEEVMQPMGQRMGLGAIAAGGQAQAPQRQQPQGQGRRSSARSPDRCLNGKAWRMAGLLLSRLAAVLETLV